MTNKKWIRKKAMSWIKEHQYIATVGDCTELEERS